MLFIGICGASGSGKSTLAEELARMVNKSILIINQDAYYYDHPDMSFEERCKLNYDEPRTVARRRRRNTSSRTM